MHDCGVCIFVVRIRSIQPMALGQQVLGHGLICLCEWLRAKKRGHVLSWVVEAGGSSRGCGLWLGCIAPGWNEQRDSCSWSSSSVLFCTREAVFPSHPSVNY